MMRKIAPFITIVMIFTIFTIPDAFASGIVEVELIQSNAEMGNVFFDNNMPGYTVEIKCNKSVPYSVVLKNEVKDSSGEIVWESTENSTLSPKTKTLCQVMPNIDKYGIFTITSKVSGSFGEVFDSKEFGFAAGNNTDNDFIGTTTHFTNFSSVFEKQPQTIYLTQCGGILWIREGVKWKDVEQQKAPSGEPKIYKMHEPSERMINNLVRANRKIVFPLSYNNRLYDNGEFPKTEEGIDAYVQYCKYVANYFKGRVDVYEVGNEPDLEAFTIRDVSGDEYAKVLKRARDAIKEVDENITVIGGSFCSHRNEHNKEFLTQFSDEVNKNGGWKNYMDYVSYHPYSSDGDYSDEVSVMTFLQNFDYVQQQLGTDIPVWITEFGTSTKTSEGREVFSFEQQAADLARTIVAAKSEPMLKYLNIYNFRAKENVDNPREQNFGIVSGDYNAKPAFIALSYLNRTMNGAEFVKSYANRDFYSGDELIVNSNRTFDTYRFKNGDTDIFVMWARKGMSADITVTNGNLNDTEYTENKMTASVLSGRNKTVEIRDMYGNLIEENSFTLTEMPIYVICRPPFSITDNGSSVQLRGTTEKPYSKVTLMAEKRGELTKRIVAVEQTESDNNGNYRFNFKIDENDAYILYITENGEKNSFKERNCDYDMDVSISVNGKNIEKISDINDGDIVKATLDINKNTENAANLLFVGAIKNSDSALSHIGTDKIVWDGNSAVANIEMEFLKSSDAELMQLLLWKENLSPICEPYTVKK